MDSATYIRAVMSKNKIENPELKSRLEKALRENLKKRKAQQRERKDLVDRVVENEQPLNPLKITDNQ